MYIKAENVTQDRCRVQGKSDAPAVANAILFLLSALETHNLNIVIIIHKNTTHVSNGHKVGKACAY